MLAVGRGGELNEAPFVPALISFVYRNGAPLGLSAYPGVVPLRKTALSGMRRRSRREAGEEVSGTCPTPPRDPLCAEYRAPDTAPCPWLSIASQFRHPTRPSLLYMPSLCSGRGAGPARELWIVPTLRIILLTPPRLLLAVTKSDVIVSRDDDHGRPEPVESMERIWRDVGVAAFACMVE